jgi:hypothetical protein
MSASVIYSDISIEWVGGPARNLTDGGMRPALAGRVSEAPVFRRTKGRPGYFEVMGNIFSAHHNEA